MTPVNSQYRDNWIDFQSMTLDFAEGDSDDRHAREHVGSFFARASAETLSKPRETTSDIGDTEIITPKKILE